MVPRRTLLSSLCIGSISLAGCSNIRDQSDPNTNQTTNSQLNTVDTTVDYDLTDISSSVAKLIQTHKEAISQIGVTITSSTEGDSVTETEFKINASQSQSIYTNTIENSETQIVNEVYSEDSQLYSQVSRPNEETEYRYNVLDNTVYMYTGEQMLVPLLDSGEFTFTGEDDTGDFTKYEYSISEIDGDSVEGRFVISEHGVIVSFEYTQGEEFSLEFNTSKWGKTTVEQPGWISEVDQEQDRVDE